MNRIAAAWAWAIKNKTLILAAILTGGEAIVTMGLPLPGSDFIPPPLRGAAIGLLMAMALYFRTKAQQPKEPTDAA
jgi:hypothetical protein